MIGIRSINSLLRGFVFIIFFILSARSVFVYLSYLPGIVQVAGIIAVLACIILCWWKTIWMLYLFVAVIPLISGIQVCGFMASAPLLGFIFSSIYISWFSKRIFWDKKGFASQNIITKLIDLLSCIVCLSIIVCLYEYPFDFSIYRLQYASVLGQEDPFWFMEAGYRLLQGLFLYRIFDLEINDKKDWNYFIPCFYCHAVTIIVFAFMQLMFNIPDQKGLGSIFSPFQDIHAYGGYVLILFLFFAYPVLKKKEYTKISSLLALFLLICILISGSTSTLVWLFVIGGILSLVIYGKQKKIFFAASIILIIIVGINLFPSLVPKGGHNAVLRYVQRLNYTTALEKLGGRFSSGDQALGIMKEFPCTGSGIGSFFKVSRYYHFSDKAHPERHENAHNYYFQFGAELGIPALILFIMILFCVFKKSLHPPNNVYITGLLYGLSAYLLSMLTGHHLILSNHQFLFWFLLFVISFSKDSSFQGRFLYPVLCVLFFIVAAGHCYNLFYSHKKVRGPYEYGFYEKEKIQEKKIRWTMKVSGSKEVFKTDIIRISVYAEPDKLSNKNLSLDLYINNVQIDTVYFNRTGFNTLCYYIPGIKNHEYVLQTKVSKIFNPYKLGLTKNFKHNRDQGVALEKIRYLTNLEKKYKKVDYNTILKFGNH